jgi:Leucine-rich repeat (LRR) protein
MKLVYLCNLGLRSIKDVEIPLDVEELNISHNNLTNLNGVEKFKNLRILNW